MCHGLARPLVGEDAVVTLRTVVHDDRSTGADHAEEPLLVVLRGVIDELGASQIPHLDLAVLERLEGRLGPRDGDEAQGGADRAAVVRGVGFQDDFLAGGVAGHDVRAGTDRVLGPLLGADFGVRLLGDHLAGGAGQCEGEARPRLTQDELHGQRVEDANGLDLVDIRFGR